MSPHALRFCPHIQQSQHPRPVSGPPWFLALGAGDPRRSFGLGVSSSESVCVPDLWCSHSNHEKRARQWGRGERLIDTTKRRRVGGHDGANRGRTVTEPSLQTLPELYQRDYPRGVSADQLIPTRARAECADAELLARLKAALDGRGAVSRKALCAQLEVSDDRLREAARFSNGEVLASSSRGGYRLTRQTETQLVNRVCAELLSRAACLRKRVAEITAVLNNRDRRAS